MTLSSWLRGAASVFVCSLAVGCVDTGNANNDNTAGHRQAQSTDAGRDARVTTATLDAGSASTGGGDTQPGGGDGTDDMPAGGSDDAGDNTGTESSGDDGGAPPTMTADVIAGTATSAMCLSYSKVSGDMCAGYYCGVTEDEIAAELPADTLCPNAPGACDGKLTTAVAKCARDVKSANPLNTNAQNRPLVQSCVYQDADLKANTPVDCLSCFLDAAECAGDNCLLDCLAGDSKGCDACRAANQCDTPVFACAKLPSPF